MTNEKENKLSNECENRLKSRENRWKRDKDLSLEEQATSMRIKHKDEIR